MDMDGNYRMDTFSHYVREQKLKNDYANTPRSSNLKTIIPQLEIIAQERQQWSNTKTSIYKAANTKVIQCNIKTSTPHESTQPEVEPQLSPLRKKHSNHDVSIEINYKTHEGNTSTKNLEAPIQALSRYCDKKLTDEELAMIFLKAIKTIKARSGSKSNTYAYKEAETAMKNVKPCKILKIQESNMDYNSFGIHLKQWNIDSIRYVKRLRDNKSNSLDYKADFFEKEKISKLRASDNKVINSESQNDSNMISHILDKQYTNKKIEHSSIMEIFNDTDALDSCRKDVAINSDLPLVDECISSKYPNIIFSEIQNYNVDTKSKYSNQHRHEIHTEYPCFMPSEDHSLTRLYRQDSPISDLTNKKTDNPHFTKERISFSKISNNLHKDRLSSSVSKRKINVLRSNKLVNTQSFISTAINTDINAKNFDDSILKISDRRENFPTKTCVEINKPIRNTIFSNKLVKCSNDLCTKNSIGEIGTIYQNEDFTVVSEIDEAGTSAQIPNKIKQLAQVYRLDNLSNGALIFKASLQSKTKISPIPTKNIRLLRPTADIPFTCSEEALSKTASNNLALNCMLEGARQSTNNIDDTVRVKQSLYNLADIFQMFRDDTSDGRYRAFVHNVFSDSFKKIVDAFGSVFSGIIKHGPSLASSVLKSFTDNIATANILPVFGGESASATISRPSGVLAEITVTSRHSLPLSLLKPYICDICDSKFTFISQLQHHKEEHLDPSFKCTVCKKEFERTTQIRHKDTTPHYHAVSSQENIRDRTRIGWGQFRRRRRKMKDQNAEDKTKQTHANAETQANENHVR